MCADEKDVDLDRMEDDASHDGDEKQNNHDVLQEHQNAEPAIQGVQSNWFSL